MKIMQYNVSWLRFGRILPPSDDDGEDAETSRASGQERRTGKRRLTLLASGAKWLIGLFFLADIIAPQLLFMVTHADTISVMDYAEISYIIATNVANELKYALLLRRRRDVLALVRRLEAMVNREIARGRAADSASTAAARHFERCERVLRRLCLLMVRLGHTCYVLYVGRPLALIGWAVWTDAVTADTFVAPFNDIYYFFDASASLLVFGICYAVTTTAMYAVVSALCVVDLLYLGSVFYLVALYEQLAHQIGELNGRGGRTTRRGQQLRACVQLHIDILSCVQSADGLMGGIVFVQLMYVMLTMAMCVFAASFVGAAEKFIFFIHASMYASELFMYCYVGSLVLNKVEELRVAVYQLNWYTFTRTEQRMINLLMERTARPTGFRALNYIDCNNVTFAQVMSNVFSALAFLQSFE